MGYLRTQNHERCKNILYGNHKTIEKTTAEQEKNYIVPATELLVLASELILREKSRFARLPISWFLHYKRR